MLMKKILFSGLFLCSLLSMAQTNDYRFAPNSYIFEPNQVNDGMYIPVAKAYAMWSSGDYMGGAATPSGTITADVLWEDVPGLIKSGTNYSLDIIGWGTDAKIKIPIDKSKKGNAVIAYKVNGEILWSWHVWVTDDPTQGPTYKSFDALKREKSDGTVELIPSSDWQWMDRNLGAVGSSITSGNWIKNGGLLYQWGRKDPIPPLLYKGNDFYEVTGSAGRIRHQGFIDNTGTTTWTPINALTKLVKLSDANVKDNIRLAVKNPLSLIYVNKDDNSGQALYGNNANLPVNWFGNLTGLDPVNLSQLNLWSDNSKGLVSNTNYNDDSNAAPYRNKSSFDPCPNGWRVPSMLVANIGDVRLDFSPYGIKRNMKQSDLDLFGGIRMYLIKPNDTNVPSYFKGFKVYSNFGIDMSKLGGNNMGVFPGTGAILRNYHNGQYTDQHHVGLWTATMVKWATNDTSVVSAASFGLTPDKSQGDIPDPSLPNVTGRFNYNPIGGSVTSDAIGCRCVKDPLFVVNNYNFPTEFFNDEVEYKEGMKNPNSYTLVKSVTETMLSIPISKAFSVQSSVLGNKEILNSANYKDLKANVLWTDNPSLVTKVTIANPSPASLAAITNTNIDVKIGANQSGNAVITLHNGSLTNPVYWSWHVWVTNSEITTVPYVTDVAVAEASNYLNYVKPGNVLSTEFMDRNLGARDEFPTISGTPNATNLAKIRQSGGLHYQWGRKDPIPSFVNIGQASYSIYLGKVASDGTVSYPTTIDGSTYNTSYVVPSNTYNTSSNILATDKISAKISKILTYSVNNPLVFMMPSAKQPYQAGYTNGTDWLSMETNLAANRWGRGEEKSVFDPCPEGWRIPDVLGTSLANVNYGLTPYYKKNVNESAYAPVATTFQGTYFTYSGHWGFLFDNAAYKIGNYPISGIRGSRSVYDNSASVINSTVDIGFYKMWMAGMSGSYGRPISMAANVSSKYMATYDDNADPYFGASCRCVKIKPIVNGIEGGPLEILPLDGGTLGTDDNASQESNDKLKAYPNPVSSILKINGNSNKVYTYQVVDMTGKVVRSGKFLQNETDLSGLLPGVYLLNINNREAVIKILKR